jgi:uncharacterized protein
MFSFQPMHWDFALILISLAVGPPLLGRRRIRQIVRMPETSKRDRLSLYATTVGFQWCAVALIFWRASRGGISPFRMGIAIPNVALTATVSIVLAIVVLVNQILSLGRLAERPSGRQDILPQLALKIFPQDSAERLIFFAVVVTVSVCEEVIYRGFALAVFLDWFGAHRVPVAAILASALLFALGHIYQGRRGSIGTFVVGILFAAVRVSTGSLVPAVIAHFTADWTVGLMARSRLRATLAPSLAEPAAGRRGERVLRDQE